MARGRRDVPHRSFRLTPRARGVGWVIRRDVPENPLLIPAAWREGYAGQLPDGTILQPGDTTFVPISEAVQSPAWDPQFQSVDASRLADAAAALGIAVPKGGKANVVRAIEDHLTDGDTVVDTGTPASVSLEVPVDTVDGSSPADDEVTG